MKTFTTICVIVFTTFYAVSQPCTIIKELNRKRHKIEGSTYGHPYTTFDRHNGIGFQKTIENIRKKIIEESPENVNGPIYTAYKLLYIFASKPMPTDNGMHNESPSELALWAKNNAFVVLIGLNGNAESCRSGKN